MAVEVQAYDTFVADTVLGLLLPYKDIESMASGHK
ncbi:hypothetical protein A2U01_0086585, partial [Trifolium medium]|nr:hypothetical protein [Trifolium medium]